MTQSSTAAILFCDLVDSTKRLVELGDDKADGFVLDFLALCRKVIEEHGGTVVKSLGDGLMAVFEGRTLSAIQTATDLHERIAALDPTDPPVLRIGISVGEVKLGAGDWYGRPVIEASRLCGLARPGETLASDVVRIVIGSRGNLAFVPAGEHSLKGLPGLTTAVRIEMTGAPAPAPFAPTPPPSSAPGEASSPDLEMTTTRDDLARHQRWSWKMGVAASIVAASIAATLAWSTMSDRTTTGKGAPSSGQHLSYTPVWIKKTCAADVADPARECGSLHVPMDRNRPGGPWIDVPLDSWSPVGTATQLVTLEIGSVFDPNQSPSRLVGRQFRLGVRGREGVPLLNCPEVTVAGKAHLLDPLFSDAAVSAHVDALRACRDRWTSQHTDPAKFSEEDVALDVLDAISALDLTKIDLVAGTDQTPAAYSLMRDHAELLRTVTLINPEAPDMSSGQLVLSFQAAFRSYATLCRADPRCATALPDPEGTWKKIYQQLQASPALESGTLADGTPLRMVVDGDRGATALEVALGSTPLLPYLHLTLAGNAAAAAAGNAYEKSDTSNDVPIGADLSDVCNRIAPNDKALDGDQIRRFPEFRSGRFRLVEQSCAAWNVPASPTHFRSAVASAIPTFVVVGSLSSATDSDAVNDLIRGLDHVTLLRFPTLGFSPMFDGPPCLSTTWRKWLIDPSSQPSDSDVATCVSSAPPIPFLDHL